MILNESKKASKEAFSYAFSHAGYLILVIIYDKIINTKGKP